MTKWMEAEGPLKPFIISSRIRLARNFTTTPFPLAMNEEMARGLIGQIRERIIEGSEGFRQAYGLYETVHMNLHEKQLLLEKHLVSSEFIKARLPGMLMINREESISIMVNEEDHLRIQCLLPGLQLYRAWDAANEVDDYIDEMMSYAFDDTLGYLTSCPTNVGTGLRASVMMHLPALTLSGAMDRILQAASQIGLAVRGLYGEGSEAHGNMFQISNQQTLGRTEGELIDTLNDVAGQIATEERKARDLLLDSRGLEVEDRVWRSFGILKNSRMLTSKEALERLSDLRLGIETGLFEALDLKDVDELLFRIQPAFLQETAGRDLLPSERDSFRAEWVRSKL